MTAKGPGRKNVGLLQAVLVLSSLCSAAFGDLQDRDLVGDPILTWPVWYRDKGSTSPKNVPVKLLQLCTSPALDTAGNPLCFPIVPTPSSFNGNIGDEVFYYNAELVQKTINGPTGYFDLRYQAALEAAYLSADGTPVHGKEVVFSRIRIILDINDDPAVSTDCLGKFTITHPYGVNEFDITQAGARAVTYTNDVGATELMFDIAVREGEVGPWLTSTDGNGQPITITGDNGHTFIGNPNVDSTYTGSPFGTNYVELQSDNPACLLSPNAAPGPAQNKVRFTTAAIMGQIYTGRLLQPTIAVSAVYSPATTYNQIDVVATATAGDVLWVSGDAFPAARMREVSSGQFRAHLKTSNINSKPAQLFVTNVNVAPIVTKSIAVVDRVGILYADYYISNNVKKLCVYASSSHGTSNTLTVTFEGGTDTTMITGSLIFNTGCNGHINPVQLNGNVRYADITVTGPQPAFVSVKSSSGGIATSLVQVSTSLSNTFDNDPAIGFPSITNPTFTFSLAKPFNVDGQLLDFYSPTKYVSFATSPPTSWPTGATLYIASQPKIGDVRDGTAIIPGTLTSADGKLIFHPAPDTPNGLNILTFRVFVTYQGKASGMAEVTMRFTAVAPPPPPVIPADAPTTLRDIFAIQATFPRVINVLRNDVAPFDATSVKVVLPLAPEISSAVVNPTDGTIRVTLADVTATTPATTKLQYTLAVATGSRSAPTNVDINIARLPETLLFKAAVKADSQKGTWDIILSQANPDGWTLSADFYAHCFLMAVGSGATGVGATIGSGTLTGPNPTIGFPKYIGSGTFGTTGDRATISVSISAGGTTSFPELLSPPRTTYTVPSTDGALFGLIRCATTNQYVTSPTQPQWPPLLPATADTPGGLSYASKGGVIQGVHRLK